MAATPSIELSALIPCLNEEENVAAIAAAVAAEFAKARVSYEIVFIDNGSVDRTVEIIKTLCAADDRIRLIVNNRNFGQMRSPTYGVYQTVGKAVIGISADFQDPPELIGTFIDRWREGTHIVLGVRRSEDTSLVTRLIRDVGYALLSRFGDYPVIPGATGFGIYDRAVIDCLRQWRDPEPFFRGMLVESGFSLETVLHDRPPRTRGATKNNFGTLLHFALIGLASSSKRLLRFPIYVAILVAGAMGLTLLAVIARLLAGKSAWGLAAFAAGEGGFALLFLSVGLIGEQLRLVAEMSRNVPLVIEKERVNFPPSAN